MSRVIPPLGSLEVTLDAADKICVATRGRAVYASKAPASSDKVLDSANPVFDVDVNGEEFVSGAFATGGVVLVQNMGPYPAYIEVGTAPLSKDFRRETGLLGSLPTLNVTGDLTTAMIQSGGVTSTTAAGVVATLPTGAVMDAAGEWAIGEGITWGALASGGSAFTVTAAASGHTVVGAGAVATTTSAMFRTVKTAADTFVTTRIG